MGGFSRVELSQIALIQITVKTNTQISNARKWLNTRYYTIQMAQTKAVQAIGFHFYSHISTAHKHSCAFCTK